MKEGKQEGKGKVKEGKRGRRREEVEGMKEARLSRRG